MTDKQFYTIWSDALKTEDRDAFVSKALSGEFATDDKQGMDLNITEYIEKIWDIAHLSVRDIVKASGMSQAKFAMHFCIPLRTVENWCRGVNKCADYDRLMMARCLNLL